MKCLFTNDTILPGNKKEHLIPKTLGGRLVRTDITSSNFNNEASRIDSAFDSFVKVLNLFAPKYFLGNSNQEYKDLSGNFKAGGEFGLERNLYPIKNAEGKPESWVGPENNKKIQELIKSGKNFERISESPNQICSFGGELKPINLFFLNLKTVLQIVAYIEKVNDSRNNLALIPELETNRNQINNFVLNKDDSKIPLVFLYDTKKLLKPHFRSEFSHKFSICFNREQQKIYAFCSWFGYLGFFISLSIGVV